MRFADSAPGRSLVDMRPADPHIYQAIRRHIFFIASAYVVNPWLRM